MKNFIFVLIALAAGFVGAYVYDNKELILGATTARTTITNPWTFSATTTLNSNLVVTTTNSATSTIQVGCIETTSTSTATKIKQEFVTTGATSTYAGTVYWSYGKCPRI